MLGHRLIVTWANLEASADNRDEHRRDLDSGETDVLWQASGEVSDGASWRLHRGVRDSGNTGAPRDQDRPSLDGQ